MKLRYAFSLLLLLPLLAFAANTYDVTATMPSVTGASSSTVCQLFMNGASVGSTKPCGSAQSYPALMPGPGTYALTYRTVDGGVQSASPSPARTVTVPTSPPPSPITAPSVTVTCTPAPCDVTVNVTP